MPNRSTSYLSQHTTHCLDLSEYEYYCTRLVQHEGNHYGGSTWEQVHNAQADRAAGGLSSIVWSVNEQHPLWTGQGGTYVLEPGATTIRLIRKAPETKDRRTTKAGLLP